MKALNRREASPSSLYAGGLQLEGLLQGYRRGGADAEPVPGIPSAAVSGLRTAGETARAAKPVPAPAAPTAFAGASLVWVGAWANLLPAAIGLTALTALIYFDVATGYSISGRVSRWLQLRRLSNDFDAELRRLFDVPRDRPMDHEAIEAFIADWRKTDDAWKDKLILQASGDADFWREKLVAAYLIEPSDKLREELLSALQEAPGKADLPLGPVLAALIERRAQSRFLAHPAVAARLERLVRVLGDETTILPEAPRNAPPKRWSRQRVAAALALGVSLTLALFSGSQALEYRKLRREEARVTRDNFYGESAFIFRDTYKDPRIASVLKLLERWHSLGPKDAAALESAIETLRTSADPKADNVLEALYRRSGSLPLSAEARRSLLKTLLERDNEGVWRFAWQELEDHGDRPETVLLVKEMIRLGVQLGKEKTFQNVFQFLASEDPEIRAEADKAVRASLDDPAKAKDRLFRLNALSLRFQQEGNFELLLQVERLLLEYLGRPDTPTQLANSADILDRVLDSAEKLDAWRPRAVATLPPGQEGRMPPPLAEGILAELERALEASRHETLTQGARFQLNRILTRLVNEGKQDVPGLAEDLKEARVTSVYGETRDKHNLAQIRALRDAVRKAAQAPSARALPPEAREYLHRAGLLLEALPELAEKAGMADGESVGEQAAQDVNDVLQRVRQTSWSTGVMTDHMLESLKRQGLADADGYLQSYDAAQVRRIELMLLKQLQDNAGFDYNGAPRELYGYEKTQLLRAIELLDKLIDRHFPGQETGSERQAGETLGRVLLGLKDPTTREAADRRARALLTDASLPWVDRLSAAAKRHEGDPEISAWLLRYVAEKLASEPNPDVWTLQNVWIEAAKTVAASDRGEPFMILERAVEAFGAGPARAAPAPLVAFTRERIKNEIDALIRESEDAFPGLEARLIELAVRPAPAYAPPGVRNNPRLRDVYKQRDLESLLQAVREAAAAPNAGAAQRRALASIEERVPALLRLGSKIDMPSGRSAGEIAADKVNHILYDGYALFAYDCFLTELQQNQLAPPPSNKPGSKSADNSFEASYTQAELRRLVDHLKGLLASGQGWEAPGKRRALNSNEIDYLQDAIRKIEAVLKDYPAA